jgi:hypothetical protein
MRRGPMTPAEAKKLYGNAIIDIEQFRESVKQSLKHVTDDTKSKEPEAYERLSGWCNPEPGDYRVSYSSTDVTFTQQMTAYYSQVWSGRSITLSDDMNVNAQDESEIELKPEPKLGVRQWGSGHYSEYLFTKPGHIVKQYVNAVEDGLIPEHDTLIGTGLSGSIAAGILAHATDKMFMVLRKEGTRHHSSHSMEGRIGAKWIFVDDFIGGGHTRRRVHEAVDKLTASYGVRTTYVGSWLYLRAEYEKER